MVGTRQFLRILDRLPAIGCSGLGDVGLHILAGILLQLLMFVRSFILGNYNKSHLGVSATSLFWHFVDVIWTILFSLLYLW